MNCSDANARLARRRCGERTLVAIRSFCGGVVLALFLGILTPVNLAQEPAADDGAVPAQKPLSSELKKTTLKHATALTPDGTLWLDQKQRSLYFDATVVLDAGLLEMLCCPAQTKEHESILATTCPPRAVHAALLALGAETGTPVQFEETVQPPQGEQLEINLIWKTAAGELKTQDARKWIRTVTRRYFTQPLPALPAGLSLPEEGDLKYDDRHQELLHFGVITPAAEAEFLRLSNDPDFQAAVKKLRQTSLPSPLTADWVFVGSSFRQDPETGRMLYLADGGDFICVANFPSAMIDIAEKSSAADANRGYEANSDVVPPLGTPVLIQIQRTRDQKPAVEPTEPTAPPTP